MGLVEVVVISGVVVARFALPDRFKASSMIWLAKSGAFVGFDEGSALAILRWKYMYVLI